MRGADLLAQTLAAAGVTKVFSLSGNQIMPVYDACLEVKIEIVHTRHEAASVFMADAWAQLTGEIGICLVTAAPGAANAFGPLYTARQSESPVLFLTGDSPMVQDGRGAFQELDQVAMTAPVTKLSLRATDPSMLGRDTVKAIQLAMSGRPGPVHLALPFDVLEADATGAQVPGPPVFRPQDQGLNPDDARTVIEALEPAAAPLVLCGPALSFSRCGKQLSELAVALDAPVVAMESPRGLKDPALGDFAKAVAKADLVVSLGKPVNFSLGFGGTDMCLPTCRWIVIDAEADERKRARLNLGDRLDQAINADPKAAAATLAKQGSGGAEREAWRSEVTGYIAARNCPAGEPVPGEAITPAQLCAAVQRHVASAAESVVISDGGEFGQWSQAGTHADYRIINGPGGAIGGALCYGLAAKLARPDATVFALMGDGTVGFHLAEFETAVRANTPFVVVIGNDGRWNAEHLIQMRDYGPDRLIGCQLSDARYDEAVKALGGHGEYVTDLADLDDALSRAVTCGKVACVNVVIEGVPAPAGSAH
ncbi:thiamine pyrophosphate-binding protein [Anderseniella sp. Alg231-50]|uniref:thiamine pyrophosphate-binding protein n=1 Tax=Anderseniella sp. Alg231-50 TaxID=1922226 RepID=UPI000D5616C9